MTSPTTSRFPMPAASARRSYEELYRLYNNGMGDAPEPRLHAEPHRP